MDADPKVQSIPHKNLNMSFSSKGRAPFFARASCLRAHVIFVLHLHHITMVWTLLGPSLCVFFPTSICWGTSKGYNLIIRARAVSSAIISRGTPSCTKHPCTRTSNQKRSFRTNWWIQLFDGKYFHPVRICKFNILSLKWSSRAKWNQFGVKLLLPGLKQRPQLLSQFVESFL